MSAKSRYAKVFPLVTFRFPLVTSSFHCAPRQKDSITIMAAIRYDHQISRNVTTTQCPRTIHLLGVANFLSW